MSKCIVEQLFRQKIGKSLPKEIFNEHIFTLIRSHKKHSIKSYELLIDICLTRPGECRKRLYDNSYYGPNIIMAKRDRIPRSEASAIVRHVPGRWHLRGWAPYDILNKGIVDEEYPDYEIIERLKMKRMSHIKIINTLRNIKNPETMRFEEIDEEMCDYSMSIYLEEKSNEVINNRVKMIRKLTNTTKSTETIVEDINKSDMAIINRFLENVIKHTLPLLWDITFDDAPVGHLSILKYE